MKKYTYSLLVGLTLLNHPAISGDGDERPKNVAKRPVPALKTSDFRYEDGHENVTITVGAVRSLINDSSGYTEMSFVGFNSGKHITRLFTWEGKSFELDGFFSDKIISGALLKPSDSFTTYHFDLLYNSTLRNFDFPPHSYGGEGTYDGSPVANVSFTIKEQ